MNACSYIIMNAAAIIIFFLTQVQGLAVAVCRMRGKVVDAKYR